MYLQHPRMEREDRQLDAEGDQQHDEDGPFHPLGHIERIIRPLCLLRHVDIGVRVWHRFALMTS